MAVTHTRPRLRVLGTSVTLLEQIRRRAERDLDIELEFIIRNAADAQRMAVMEPEAYDVYDQWFHDIDFVWPARAIQPIDVARIARWDELTLRARGRTSQGLLDDDSVPLQRLFVQPDGNLSAAPSDAISMLPLTHNVDSFVYCDEPLPDGLTPEEASWGWLLDERFAGRVALQAEPSIGVLDMALAASAWGMSFGCLGNLRIEEIDALTALLQRKRKSGHFTAFWANEAEAMELMASHRVCLQSLWSPALMRLHRGRHRYRLARPREGYRAWLGGMSLSCSLHGRALDAAYAYLNWWLDGWPGAVMARQGYYLSTPERTRQHLTAQEWDYWYVGLPARSGLCDADGVELIAKGAVREGGSYTSRMSHIGVWNTVMDEHNYLVRQWTRALVE
ncbi:ABC transporter substrate-binding protein [Salinicola peritrichatus]|uniref:ABC transporter substrate-binding protein n=1 Tax=Salinicola peritrichatus TaxID=1267424 RepID=UPI000DA25A77|nr:signal peptide prediction [Salinicola peritrichatus]